MANEDLTELHYFGIPTAFFDIFPKGQPVVIRTVVGTAVLCILHPTVADLALRRIANAEFELLLEDFVPLTVDVLEDIALTIAQLEQAKLPITIHQIVETHQEFVGYSITTKTQIQSTTVSGIDTRDTEAPNTKDSTVIVETDLEVDGG